MRDDNGRTGPDALGRLQVDAEHLRTITDHLDRVADTIQSDLRSYVHEVNMLATTGGFDNRSALGSMEIPQVHDLAGRINSTFQAVDNTLEAMAEQLRRDGAAVQQIAEKYRTADERNAATAADFTAALGG